MDEFSIIGTTDVEYKGDPQKVAIDDKEINYLLNAYNAHFKRRCPATISSGPTPASVRCATTNRIRRRRLPAITRWIFMMKRSGAAAVGLWRQADHLSQAGRARAGKTDALLQRHRPGMDQNGGAARRRYRRRPRRLRGQTAPPLLVYQRIDGAPLCPHLRQQQRADPAEAASIADLGEDFGHEFYEAELKYLVEHEWVRTLEDAIWRRTKQGMWLNDQQQARIGAWLAQHTGKSELSLAS
jgi:glycerol-3-phosphate dehydrogenase